MLLMVHLLVNAMNPVCYVGCERIDGQPRKQMDTQTNGQLRSRKGREVTRFLGEIDMTHMGSQKIGSLKNWMVDTC